MRQAFFSRSLRFEMKIARLLAALRASYRAMRVVARFARHRGSLLISRGGLLGSLLNFMVRQHAHFEISCHMYALRCTSWLHVHTQHGYT